MRILALIFTILSFCVLPQTLHAQNTAEGQSENLVKIRLLSERGNIKAGEEITIGIEQTIEPHWHTYWKNPGDSGTALAANWTLPDGFAIDDIQWPTPKKIPYGPLLNYGYEDQVILLQPLKIPDEIPNGAITLTADIEVLVCKEECIPEYGTYTLTLNGENASTEDNTAYLEAAKQKRPTPKDWPIFYNETDGNFTLQITPPAKILKNIALESAQFLPEDWGLISNAEPVNAAIKDKNLILTQKRGDRSLAEVNIINAIIKFQTNDNQTYNTAIKATPLIQEIQPVEARSPEISEDSQATKTADLTILSAIAFALLGGLILNLMPCVFPVLSIKALSLVKIAEKSRSDARKHGLAYTAGVILSFLAIAGTLIALQKTGAQIGWGFQFQNPIIISLLAYLLFIIGLNLSGFFEFSNPFANTGGKLTQNNNLSGSFFTGVLATLVATPCTAPFMAGAIGFALVQPAFISLLIFATLGLGLALPYLALSFLPNLQKIMPKPGAWMDVFKQILSFPMFIAALWMLWVLGEQLQNPESIAILALGAITITFGIWLLKHTPKNKAWRIILYIIALIMFAAALWIMPKSQVPMDETVTTKQAEKITFGAPFTPQSLQTALDSNAPIFTEMTAAWCITCKVNHKIAINVKSTKKLFSDNNVQYLIGDWTNEDPEITKYLQKHGRNGVPLYVYYGPPDDVTNQRPAPKILPQVLTPAVIKNYMNLNP